MSTQWRRDGSASAETPSLEGLKCDKNAAKVLAENARFRLKPFVGTSRKTGSPNVRPHCFEVVQQRAALPDVVTIV